MVGKREEQNRDDALRNNFRRARPISGSDSSINVNSKKVQESKKSRLINYQEVLRRYKLKGLQRKPLLITGVIAVIGVGGLYGLLSKNNSNSGENDAQQANGQASGPRELPKVDKYEFSILTPSGRGTGELNTVLISPPENPPVYAFTDELSGATIKISQQELPQSFKGDEASKLEELAKSFQAQNVIEIDGNKVYHGFSDKGGGIQSLVLIRKGLLVLISSNKKLSDDIWFGYVTKLNK